MKNLLIPTDRAEILERINKLTPETKNTWGKMNVQQMMCHVSDPMRDALGEINTKHSRLQFLKFMFKPMLLGEKQWKPNVSTYTPYNQVKGNGTKPTTFDNDKKILIDSIGKFASQDAAKSFLPHVLLGDLPNKDYGELMYKHADHHLRSFGV